MNKRLVLLISIFATILIFTNSAQQMLRSPMDGSDEAGEEAVLPVDVTGVFSGGSSDSPEKGLTAVTPSRQLLETIPFYESAAPPVTAQSTTSLLDVSFPDRPVQDQSNTDFEPQSSNPTISSLLPTPLPTATPLTDELISDLSNVSDDLRALYGQRSSQSMPTIQGPFTQAMVTSEDRVEVTLTVSSNQADTVKEAVLSLGGSVTAAYEIWIDAWIPIDTIPQVAALPGVTRVSTPLRTLYDDSLLPLEHAQVVSPLAGSVITQGVALTKADTWHAVNILGDGVKVAIIDFFADYEDAQANGELPASINLFTAYVPLDRSSNHGTAVAEIIYDMAPGAQLTFASADTPATMAQTIRSLAEAGNQVISSSVGYIGADAGDGIGPLADAIAYARSLGTLYVQSAGNYAYNSHWDGYFQDTDGDNIHEFSSGVETLEFNLVIAAGDARPITIYLRWNDWNAERSGNANQQDYDLELLRWNETSNDWDLIAASTVAQRDPETKPTPFEMLQGSIDGGRYGIRVRRIAASENAVLDLWVLDPEHSSWQGVVPVSARTLTDPAAAPFAFSVAAVNKVVPYNLEGYSSRGPGRGPGGTFDIGTDQPRAASFARVDTWTYGAEGFAGTSAATPHVSGLAALVFSSCPTCTPERVQAYLENHTVDMGQSGYDYLQGYGRILLGSPLDLSPLPAGDVSGLINAINTANNVGIGVIHLESAHLYSLLASIEGDVSYGPSGLPVITGDVTIIGNGSIIERDANAPDFRLFRVAETGRLELQDITLRGGQSAGNSSGAGIFNRGLVYATDVTFLENRPSNTYTYAGAIYNDGILYITGSTFSGNSAQLGSSIYNAKTVSVLDSYFYDASYAPLFNGAYEGIITLSGSTVDADSHYGPGIYNDGGKLIIYNSTIRGHGAGIQAWGSTASTTVTNSTISDNKSDGGIVNLGGAELVLDGVLLTHNYNYNDEGGALHNEGTVTITNSTISYNRGGGLYHAPTKPGQNLTINNSCIFRNYRGYFDYIGVENTTASLIDAAYNWWGYPTGPANEDYSDTVIGPVNITPHLTEPNPRDCQERPTNDDIENAIDINTTPFSDFSPTYNATTSLDDPAPSCAGDVRKTVWYKHIGTGNMLRFNAFQFDTVMAIYSGSPDNLTEIACDDNGNGGNEARIDTTLAYGQTYYIMIGGNNGDFGTSYLSVDTPPPPPDNDDFSSAVAIGLYYWENSRMTMSATGAYDDPVPSCGTNVSRSVWYQYTADVNTPVRLQTARDWMTGSQFDTVLSVWTGTRGNLEEVACNNDFDDTLGSRVDFSPIIGTTYYIMVAGNEGHNGQLMFEAQEVPSPPVSSGSISGTVFDSSGITTLEGIQVHLSSLDSSYSIETCSGPLGTFAFDDLPLDEDLIVGAWGSGICGNLGYTIEFWPDAASEEAALPLHLTAGTPSLTGVDFTLSAAELVAPELLTPAQDALITANPPRFSWTSVDNADHYEIQLERQQPFTETGHLTSSLSYVPPASLISTTYFWRVRAVSGSGETSEWSEIRSFTIQSPTDAAPTHNLYSMSTPLLSWGPITWATHYEIQVSITPVFTGITYGEVLLGTSSDWTTPYLSNGTYYWRVRAQKPDGTWSAWSPVGSFIIDVP